MAETIFAAAGFCWQAVSQDVANGLVDFFGKRHSVVNDV